MSHHEQFEWMQNHLKVKLKVQLHVWPRFVELCERRNLFTHTAGVVSTQYLKNCHEHNCDTDKVTVGQRLTVTPKYFETAVESVYEVGLKLCYVFWRKFNKAESYRADVAYNGRCMELITGRAYGLAEALLQFGCTVKPIKEEIRLMMVVNLANAIRLQKRDDEAKKILKSEDWSACKDQFQVCVASVSGDIERVLILMGKLGRTEEPDNYRNWPVFQLTRDDPRFVEKFESIYGEPLLVPSSAAVKTEKSAEVNTEFVSDTSSTVH